MPVIGSDTPAASNNHGTGGPGGIDIQEKWLESQRARLSTERQWAETLAFYLGKHYLRYNTTTQQYRLLDESPSWRFRFTSNQVLKVVMKHQDMLSQSTPKIRVLSQTSQYNDESAARTTERLLANIDRDNSGSKLLSKTKLFLLLFGCAFEKITFDKKALAHVMGEDGEISEQEVGAVKIEVFSPDEIGIDAGARTFDDAQYVIHNAIMNKAEVLAMYNRDIEEENVVTSATQWINTVGNDGYYLRRGIRVLEYWEKPTKQRPNGTYMVSANGELMPLNEAGDTMTDLPYYEMTKGRVTFPIAWYQNIDSVISPYATSVTQHIIPHNRVINRTTSIDLEIMEHDAHPPLIVEAGGTKIRNTGEPGQVWIYRRGGRPQEWLRRAGPSVASLELYKRATMDSDSIAGSASIAESAREGGAKTGRAQIAEQKLNMGRARLVSAGLEAGAEERYRIVLELVKVFYTEERILPTLGETQGPAIERFFGRDVKGTAIEVIQGSANPYDPFLERDMINEASKTGAMSPEQYMKRFDQLGLFRHQDHPPDYHRAMNENREILADVRPLVLEHDNHAMHIEIITNFIVSHWNDLSDKQRLFAHWHKKVHIAAMNNASRKKKPDEFPLFDEVTGLENPMWVHQQLGYIQVGEALRRAVQAIPKPPPDAAAAAPPTPSPAPSSGPSPRPTPPSPAVAPNIASL